jgi:hypothetical protein
MAAGGTMRADLAERIARQEVFCAPLITTPAGVAFETEVLAGVPVAWTTPIVDANQ